MSAGARLALALTLHEGPSARDRVDQTKLSQVRDRTAGGGTSHAKQVHQILLARNRIIRRQLARLDTRTHPCGDLPMGRLRCPVLDLRDLHHAIKVADQAQRANERY